MGANPTRGGGTTGTGLLARWHQAADRNLTPLQRSLLVTWIAFGTTFGTVRLITHGIRGGWLPWGNISAGGEHIHHYNFGIGTLACVGLIAVRGDEQAVGHPAVAAAYGCGTALIADEFALLLDLQDVYWAKQGRISVDVSFGILSVLGTYLTAKPFWHEIGRITRHHVAAKARQLSAGQ
ncbi:MULTISPECIES: hypothetical protein [unclassified Streptomyces]|uniref:hypothetical protein n=1 Tax=unclassified Streptomyces TaxID=2593676 RepID=UPI0021C609C2|nr:hypothetical protein [Streptomyces sp. FIT100]UUN25479.1 hypothetical protein KK483_02875 [Streptomyces sp. FIT100]